MGLAQWILIVVWIFGMADAISRHGKRERYDAGRYLNGVVCLFFLLTIGGFWK